MHNYSPGYAGAPPYDEVWVGGISPYPEQPPPPPHTQGGTIGGISPYPQQPPPSWSNEPPAYPATEYPMGDPGYPLTPYPPSGPQPYPDPTY